MAPDKVWPAPIREAVLSWFAQNSAQGVLITDTDLRIVSWNRWLALATGLTANTVLGRNLFEALPSLVERGLDQHYHHALNGQVKVLSHSFHRYIVPTAGSPQGAQMPQAGRIGPLIAGSNVVGTITVIDDVSDRVASEVRLRERIEAAESASRVKDEFLATLSHEIRTPLNAVLGWTRILRSRPDLDEATVRRAIDVIDRNAAAQLTLVSDMLDVARVSSGKVRLEMSEVDLGTIATAAVEAARPAADVKGVHLTISMEAGLGAVQGDPDRLLQVIWNLLSNAVKFTDPGGQVTVRLASEGYYLLLTVTDTGQGIEPAFLPFVFDRFKQADPSSSRRHGGLGLGLALVKDLVQLHGGTVGIESGGLGLGTTLRVRFPAGTSTPRRVSAEVRGRGGAHPLQGLRVLVVEDDRDAAEIALRALEDAAAIVQVLSSVEEALELVHRGEPVPDVIVTDIGMPDCDGYQFLATMRSLPSEQGGAVPMIALTAYASPEDRAKALRAGFDAHLPKPFDPQVLVATVDRAARQAKQGSSA